MRLRAKFNIATVVAFAIGFAIAAFLLHRVFIDNAREEVMQNARIMMTAANAIRQYTAIELVPLLPSVHNGKFVRRWSLPLPHKPTSSRCRRRSRDTPIASPHLIQPI